MSDFIMQIPRNNSEFNPWVGQYSLRLSGDKAGNTKKNKTRHEQRKEIIRDTCKRSLCCKLKSDQSHTHAYLQSCSKIPNSLSCPLSWGYIFSGLYCRRCVVYHCCYYNVLILVSLCTAIFIQNLFYGSRTVLFTILTKIEIPPRCDI